MKFRCERDVLVDAFSAAARAVGGRSALAVLAGVRLALTGDHLRLTGSDLDLTIDVELAVTGADDGVAVIPARLGADILRALPPGSVAIAVDADQAQISGGRSVFSVRTLPAEEFPELGQPSDHAVHVRMGDLVGALRQVVGAASHDEARPILTGVLIAAEPGGVRLVATDSYRLAVRDLPGTTVLDEGKSVLVPSRALAELARLSASGSDELVVRLGERDATFQVGAVRLTTRLIEGQYPPYRNLIPASLPNRLTVDRAVFAEALKRMRLLAKDATPVRLRMSSDGLELVAIAQDVGQANEEVEASYAGGDLQVAFNPEFLLAGVEFAEGDTVTLETSDPHKPAVIRSPDRPEYLYLLMPVRV